MEFAAYITEHILIRLATHVSGEIILAWGAQSELKKLNNTLSAINVVLQGTESNHGKNLAMSHWLNRLKHVCNDVDDVLDEFEFQKLRRNVLINNSKSMKAKVHKLFSYWNVVVFNRNLAHKIKKIRNTLDEIRVEKETFGLTSVGGPAARRPENRETSYFGELSEVLGRNDDKKQLVTKLLNDTCSSSDGEKVSVISISGLGGIGKTALARLVYQDKTVKEYFQRHLWVSVGGRLVTDDVVDEILVYIEEQEQRRKHGAKRRLQNALRGEKFLLLLDDVWDTDPIGITAEEWMKLKTLLDVGGNGSKIIVTTRNEAVALVMNPTFKLSLEGLSHSHAMSLFLKNVHHRHIDPDLMKIGEDIVKQCGGVPLALINLGSRLRFGREPEWLHVKETGICALDEESYNIFSILNESFDSLPSRLKLCIAFCSLFPKNYEFNSVSLVKMWMAEGYLRSPGKNANFDEIGQEYIREFCCRSFFQVLNGDNFVMQFKMHGLVHDLAISVAKEQFSTVNFRPSSDQIRHMSMSSEEVSGKFPEFMLSNLPLRTILIPYESGGITNQSFLKTCILKYKYIRLLDLSYSTIVMLPSSISSLILLRYLNLTGNRVIKKLPDSICKLLNLQILDLADCDALEELPNGIGNLINLIYLAFTARQMYLPKGIGHLSRLQSLYLRNCINLKSFGEELQDLPSLQKLWIDYCENLESLSLNMKHQTLFRVGGCKKLELMTQRKCRGLRSFMVCDSTLDALPPWLQQSSKTLKSIQIHGCHELTVLPDWLASFELLEELVIRNCSILSALPESIHCSTVLRKLEITECPELRGWCNRHGSREDWSIVEQVGKITLDEDEDAHELDESKTPD